MNTVVIFNQDSLGHGDPVLGKKILTIFLRKCGALNGLSAILFYNSGVKLLAPGSPVLGELTSLEHNGVDLVPCGTCVEHFGIEVAAGHVADFDTILKEIDRAEKVVTL